jgi:hypothetical protein
MTTDRVILGIALSGACVAGCGRSPIEHPADDRPVTSESTGDSDQGADLDTSDNTTADVSTCGNGVRDAGEDCDGSDRDGASCHSLGFMGGPLRCDARCNFDTSSCHGG